MIAMARGVPAIVTSGGGPIEIIDITPENNTDTIVVGVTIPPDTELTNITVTIDYYSNAAGSSVSIAPPALNWSPTPPVEATQGAGPQIVAFTTPVAVTDSGLIQVSIVKGQQQPGVADDFTVTITCLANGSPASASISEDYAALIKDYSF